MEEIVLNIVENDWIYKVCRKYCPDKMLSQDLAHEVILSLLEKENEVLKGCFERGEHKKYIVKKIKNDYLSSSSPFYKKYRKNIGLDLEIFLAYEDNDKDND